MRAKFLRTSEVKPIKKFSYGKNNFEVPELCGNGFSIEPKSQYSRDNSNLRGSLVFEELHSIWDLKQFNKQRPPLEVEDIADVSEFESGNIRVLDMPIKMAGSHKYMIPNEVKPFQSTIQQVIDFEHSLLNPEKHLHYYAYLTIDQSFVKAKTTQRNGGNHTDGLQGARIVPKTFINHTYIATNVVPTVFYPQPFDFSHINIGFHNIFQEMDRQAEEKKSMKIKTNKLVLINAYCVHRVDSAPEDCFRTFFRISYDTKIFDRHGNTPNPLYSEECKQWGMQPREVQSGLVQYRPLLDREKEVLSSNDVDLLSSYMSELKQLNEDTYYNFCYEGVRSKNVMATKLIIQSLAKDNGSKMQTLRLLFIASSLNDEAIAAQSKAVLIAQLLLAKAQISGPLLLNFVLEIIDQEPNIFTIKFLTLMIKDQETSYQGKNILRVIANMSSCTLNTFQFWNVAKKELNIEQTNSVDLKN